MRYAIVLLTACVVGCSSPAQNIGVGPTPVLTTAGLSAIAPIGDADVSCSDRAPIWITPAYTTGDGYLHGEWTPVLNIETYQVEISYSRDGIEPWRVVLAFNTNRTEFRYVDRESGGRYQVRVRVKNRCDVAGSWSTQLSVILGGGPENPAPPPQEEYYRD